MLVFVQDVVIVRMEIKYEIKINKYLFQKCGRFVIMDTTFGPLALKKKINLFSKICLPLMGA